MRLMVENGRALCVPCHKKTDSYLTKMLTAPLTVRAMIRAIQREVGDDQIDLTPDRASELQIRLSALLGNVMEEGRKAEMDYKRVLLASLKSSEKANRARIEAETTPEYEHYQECRHAKDLTMELLRSLRQFLRTQSEVMRLER
jgi:hypothetical protein